MLRRTIAVDMENQLINEKKPKMTCKNVSITVCLVTSYGLFYVLGFYSGYVNVICDGSNI